MIKVVHIQYSTKSAGNAAFRLQEAFLKANIDSSILSLHSTTISNGNVKRLNKWSRLIAKFDSKIQNYLTRNNNGNLGLFSYPLLGSNVSRIEEIKKSDFIYIHWALFGLLSLKSIDQLARLNKPIIFFMHDMWNITGGCHHSFTCEKYKTHCNNCPIIPGGKKKDLSFIEFENKFKLYSKFNNLYFISPSKWLFDCAKSSSLTCDKPIFYIPNVIDNKQFKPSEKNIAREKLKLNPDEKIIAFGAGFIGSPYKGWSYLQKSFEILKQDKRVKNISILIFGSGFSKQIADAIPFQTKFMGYLNDDDSISEVYNAADVFVVPSLADNQPTTVMESLCCGTPVVGFDIGGIPDMISHKKNGYLAKYKDAADLAEGIIFCLQNNIQGFKLPNFETSLTVKKHLELFDYIKSNNNRTP